MTKNSSFYECTSCGTRVLQWVGVCNQCGEWNTFVKGPYHKKTNHKLKSIATIEEAPQFKFFKTEIDAIDRVFGKGLLKGSITLLSGEPGIGKSTFLLKLIDSILNKNVCKTLYISGEESPSQIFGRAKRLGIMNKEISVLTTNVWQEALETIKNIGFELIIIDSIQTLRDEELSTAAGSPGQVKSITSDLIENFKEKEITAIVVGHKTKDGSIAGPKLLEHMVDTVMNFSHFEDGLRRLKCTKNRFGSIDEDSFFKMEEGGLIPIPHPLINSVPFEQEVGSSLYSLKKMGKDALIQLQAIVVENKFGNGKRVCQGIDLNKLNLLIAVIEKSLKLPLSSYDIYFKASWPEKIDQKDADLAIVAAILSSYHDTSLPSKLLFSGEVSLIGNVKGPEKLESLEVFNQCYKRPPLKSLYDLNEAILNRVA